SRVTERETGLRVSRLAVGAVLLMAGASLLGSTSASGAVMTYVVNSTDDEANASPTSTVCASAGSGLCTLRAAIQAANKNPGTDTILLSTPGVYRFSEALAGRGEDMAATGDLDILDAVTIAGAGAGSVIIDGNQLDRVFDVSANGTTPISAVTSISHSPTSQSAATLRRPVRRSCTTAGRRRWST